MRNCLPHRSGPIGPIGPIGPAGPAGGLPGPQGDPGNTGSTGPAGPAGPTGGQGPAGTSGSNGTNGSNGGTGLQGIQGIQGIPGIPGPSGGISWATAFERGLSIPAYMGQLGFQRSDGTLWEAIGTYTGAWSLLPRGYSSRITLGFAGDTGEPGANQTTLAASVNSQTWDAFIFGGDNSYGGEAQLENDWAAFNSLYVAQKSFPVLGNHDIDGASQWGLHFVKFSYLPGNRRYYTKVFGNGLVQIFVLHAGYNTAGTLVEPDGNTVGSVQHAWFVSELTKSTAKWKLVFFHHPPNTSEDGASSGTSPAVAPAMNWPEFASVDAIFCGHTHFTEVISFRGVPLFNASGAVRRSVDQIGHTSLNLYGASAAQSQLLWVNNTQPLYLRVNVLPGNIVVEFINADNGRVVKTQGIKELSQQMTTWGGEAISPDATLIAGQYYLGTCPSGMHVSQWVIGVAIINTLSPMTGSVRVGAETLGTWTLPIGANKVSFTPTNKNLPLGEKVYIVVDSLSGYSGWKGLTGYASGALVEAI